VGLRAGLHEVARRKCPLSESRSKQSLAFYGTLKFITVFTKVRYWSISCATPV